MSASVTPTATILAVDDDVDILDLLRHVFKRQAYRLLQAYSGEEALSVLKSDPSVDVVLLDILMPGGMSGLDVLRHIRSDPALRLIPVLLVTAVGSAEQLTAGLDAGADDYITKPFTTRELLARVNVALHIVRSQRALREAEERYRLLVETARDLVFALDLQGRFTYVSPSALAVTGYAPDKFLSPEGRLSLLNVIHPDDRQRVQEALSLALRGVSGDDLQCRLVRLDGEQRWLSLSWSPIPDAFGAPGGVQAIARDVTARRRAEDAIFQRSQELAALNLIASRVNQSLDLNTTLADALGALMEVLNIDCGVIYLVEADRAVARAWHGLSEAVLSRIRTPALSDVSWIDRFAVYHDVPEMAIPPFDQVAVELRAPSWLVAPLRERETLHGAIVLGSRAQRRFGENEVILIRTVADQIAVAVVNARLYEETRRRVDELALLNEVGRALTSTLDLDEVLNAIMEEAVGVVRGEAGSVLLLDEARGELVFAAAVGPAADQLRGVHLPRGAGIATQALSSGRPLLIADAQSDGRFYDRVDALTGLTTRSLMAVPLRARGRVIGVMEVLNKRGGLFTQDDLRLLDSLAQTAATAIDNAQLYARERIRVQQLTTLNEIAQHIVASLNAEALLHEVASLIHNRLGYPLVAAGLVDPDGRDVVIQGAAGAVRGELAVGARLPLHGALIGAVIADGHSRIENAVDGAASEAGSQADAPGSRAVVPIVLEGIVTGVVVVESPQPQAFTTIDATTLEAVAGLVATAIANSRLFEQVRRRNRELTAMHAISAAVSQSLELDAMLEAALVLTHQLFEADSSRIRLIEGDQLVLKTSLGTWHGESPMPMREPIAESFEGPSVQRGAVELLPDVSRADPASRVGGWPDRGLARPGAIAAVPLWSYDRVQGVMTLAWRAPREFGSSTQPLLAAIGQQIGVAVERGLLYEATRRRENELGVINDIIRSVTSTLDLEQVLTAAMQGVREAMQVEYGALLLVDETDGSLHFRKALGPAGERLVDQVLRPNEGIAGWVVAHRRSLCVNDAASDARYARRFEETTQIAVSSVLAAPLVVKERVIGAIEVVNKPGGMTESDEKLLNALAASVAVAIDNARLYQELAESARALERSHTQLVQSEKLAATGRLALSLAHEINNPLQAVANCLHLALEPDLSEQRRHEFLMMAREEVERLSLLIQRMLEFYRPSPGSSTSCDVNAALQRVLALAEQKFRHNRVKVDADLGAKLPAARIASDQATQVFLNLAVNAAEAMSAGGQLTIASRLDGTGDWVEVQFTDTGPGIPADVLPHIFEPFFTTKATGSGLGLAVSYSIIEGHGGRLTASSQPGQGATFSVRLRAVIDEATERALRQTALADLAER
ncbi:MAG TPA: GAF domain-containing protein [Anaerolineae bacterium]|nr:GAF domain-containing protein [Anaerolineae bacterium]